MVIVSMLLSYNQTEFRESTISSSWTELNMKRNESESCKHVMNKKEIIYSIFIRQQKILGMVTVLKQQN